MPFNIQPPEKSAIWFRLDNLTEITLDNTPLKLTLGRDGCARAVLPNELFKRPCEVIIRVYDYQLGLKGDSVKVSIHDKESNK